MYIGECERESVEMHAILGMVVVWVSLYAPGLGLGREGVHKKRPGREGGTASFLRHIYNILEGIRVCVFLCDLCCY